MCKAYIVRLDLRLTREIFQVPLCPPFYRRLGVLTGEPGARCILRSTHMGSIFSFENGFLGAGRYLSLIHI